MFLHHCTACARRQLIFPSQFTGVASTGEGTEVAFTCWCGEEQAHLLGRRAAPADRMTAA
ncbi:MAG: hypothetical protein CMH83_19920 [Nocardioides sp.]|nr:hypothetical protein [Nocardioides sp.]